MHEGVGRVDGAARVVGACEAGQEDGDHAVAE